jgi:GNAT superfamily N-acetyltransferase
MRYTIRPAKPEDAEGLTRVHVRSWQSSYRGLLAQEFLDTIDFPKRLAMWRHTLAHPENFGVYAAETPDTGELVGFCAVGKSRGDPPGFPGELYSIYLLEEAKGLGVGHALFQEGLQWLREHGLWPVALWVLKENTRARRFYERMGGHLAGEQSITIGDVRYPEVAYGWGAEV